MAIKVSIVAAAIFIVTACSGTQFSSDDKKAPPPRPDRSENATPRNSALSTGGDGMRTDCSNLTEQECHDRKAREGHDESFRQIFCEDKASQPCQVAESNERLKDGREGSQIIVKECDANSAAVCVKLESAGTVDEPNVLIGGSEKICSESDPGYGGKVYRLPPGTPFLPDLTKLTPVGQISAPSLNVPKREWRNGFPGVPNLIEWFAIRFYAMLDVPADGDYTFRIISDDGAKVYVGGQLVIVNDGIHKPTEKISPPRTLKKGPQPLVIEWFQGPRYYIALRVFWRKPGGRFEIIPYEVLTHPKVCELQDLGVFN